MQKIFTAYTDRAPVLDIACEDYGLLYRLAENRQGPVVEVTVESQALGEVPVFNVIGEIKGSQLPNEYVMLSAHFDSWDGGSGATDNGTGTIMIMEAMRILKQVYPNPRRTILVGHWSGEEQGLNGSRGYVHDHPEIVSGLQALLNQDNGTGRVENMSASGFPDAAASLARYLARVPADITRNIKFGFPGNPSGGGTDHASFVSCGAPGFGLGSGDWDYGRYTWHTNRDTYDKISWDDVKNNAALAAMLVYLASEDTVRMSREKRTVFSLTPSGQPGAWPECRDAQRSTPPLAPAPPPPPPPATPPVSFADHFSGVSAAYAAFRPRYPDALFDFLADAAPACDDAWDAGTGSGQAAVGLARHFKHVIATDASSSQIEHATPDPRIQYHVGPAESCDLADASVDLVTAAQALHWFDRPRFWAEAQRVLRPHGVIAVWTYVMLQIAPPIDEIVLHFYRDVVGPYWPPERRITEERYRTIEFPFAEFAAPDFVIEQTVTLDELAGYVRTWSATRAYLKRHGEDPVERLVAELGPVWGDPQQSRLGRWPVAMRVGRIE